jgi:hypothetical protein
VNNISLPALIDLLVNRRHRQVSRENKRLRRAKIEKE